MNDVERATLYYTQELLVTLVRGFAGARDSSLRPSRTWRASSSRASASASPS